MKPNIFCFVFVLIFTKTAMQVTPHMCIFLQQTNIYIEKVMLNTQNVCQESCFRIRSFETLYLLLVLPLLLLVLLVLPILMLPPSASRSNRNWLPCTLRSFVRVSTWALNAFTSLISTFCSIEQRCNINQINKTIDMLFCECMQYVLFIGLFTFWPLKLMSSFSYFSL